MNYASLIDGILNRRRVGISSQCRGIVMESEFLVTRLRRYIPLSGHDGCVNSILFSEDGMLAITGSDDLSIKMFNLSGGEAVKSISTIHTNNIFYAKDRPFSQCNEILSCGADGRVLWTYDLARGSSSIVLHRHVGRAHRIALVPNTCHELYSCGEDGQCLHYDLRESPAENTGSISMEFRTKKGGLRPIFSIGVNPCKPHEVALGGMDRYVRLYDARKANSEPLAELCPTHLRACQVCVTGLKYNYSGQDIVLSYNDDNIYTMSAVMTRQALETDRSSSEATVEVPSEMNAASSCASVSAHEMVFRGHRNLQTVKQVSYMGDRSEWVVSGSDCGHVFIWNAADGRLVKILPADPEGAVNCLTPHPHLPFLATSGLSSDAKIWTPQSLASSPPSEVSEVERDSRAVDGYSDNDERTGDEEYVNRVLVPGGRSHCSMESLRRELDTLPGSCAVSDDDDDDDDDDERDGYAYASPRSALRRRVYRQALREIRLELLDRVYPRSRCLHEASGRRSGESEDGEDGLWDVSNSDMDSDEGSGSSDDGEDDSSSNSSVMEGELDPGGYGERRPLASIRLAELHAMLDAFSSRHEADDGASAGEESGQQSGRRRGRAEIEEGSPGRGSRAGRRRGGSDGGGYVTEEVREGTAVNQSDDDDNDDDDPLLQGFSDRMSRRSAQEQLVLLSYGIIPSGEDNDESERSSSSDDDTMEIIMEDIDMDTYRDIDDNTSAREVEFEDVD